MELSEHHLGEIIRLVREREGVDLSSYRRGTLERRIAHRLRILPLSDFSEYQSVLANDPLESKKLLSCINIQVSRFFRSPGFRCLESIVLPDLAHQATTANRPLRVWSAGCGHGEEVYSISIMLNELRESWPGSLATDILGTDIEETALERARQGRYGESAFGETPPAMLKKYFSSTQSSRAEVFEVDKRLRQGTCFIPHNLLSASTPNFRAWQYSLVVCRNVLIYFQRFAQQQIFAHLTASVAPGGYLWLGESEQLPLQLCSQFEVVAQEDKMYRKIGF